MVRYELREGRQEDRRQGSELSGTHSSFRCKKRDRGQHEQREHRDREDVQNDLRDFQSRVSQSDVFHLEGGEEEKKKGGRWHELGRSN